MLSRATKLKLINCRYYCICVNGGDFTWKRLWFWVCDVCTRFVSLNCTNCQLSAVNGTKPIFDNDFIIIILNGPRENFDISFAFRKSCPKQVERKRVGRPNEIECGESNYVFGTVHLWCHKQQLFNNFHRHTNTHREKPYVIILIGVFSSTLSLRCLTAPSIFDLRRFVLQN